MRHIQKKEKEIHQSVGEITPENAKVTSKVCDQAMERMEKQKNFWISRMTTN